MKEIQFRQNTWQIFINFNKASNSIHCLYNIVSEFGFSKKIIATKMCKKHLTLWVKLNYLQIVFYLQFFLKKIIFNLFYFHSTKLKLFLIAINTICYLYYY